MRWRIVDEPVQCCLGMCYEGTIVNEDHVTIKYSFEFGLGTEVAYVEEFRCGYESHTSIGGVKGRGQKEREEDPKECVVAKTQPGFFKAHGARHVFMVGDEHAEEFGKLEETLSAHEVKRLDQLNKGWIERLALFS